MRRYVLDTHACVFMLTVPTKLGRRAKAAVQHVEVGRGQGFLPAAVVAEILILRGLGKLGIGLPEIERAIEGTSGLCFLPLDLDQLNEFAALGALEDPFDRLIVSAARSVGASLITRDARIAESGLVETLWA